MANIEPCEKHEIINCSICDHPASPPKLRVSGGTGKFRAGLRSVSPDHHWIRARYPSVCYDCGFPIQEGDLITRSIDDEGWICEECV